MSTFNQMVLFFISFRKTLTILLPMLILGIAYFLAFRRTIRIITASENAKFSKPNGKGTKQDTTAFKSDAKPEVVAIDSEDKF